VCNQNKFDVKYAQDGWNSVKHDKNVFNNPITDGEKQIKAQERYNNINERV